MGQFYNSSDHNNHTSISSSVANSSNGFSSNSAINSAPGSLWSESGQRAAAAAAAAAAAHFGYPPLHNPSHHLGHSGPPVSDSVIPAVSGNFSCDFWPNSGSSRSGSSTNALGQR